MMMPKSWPLCTGAESSLRERAVGEIDKEKLYCFARQMGTQQTPAFENYEFSTQEDLMRSFIARVQGSGC